ncbi:MAG: SMR family transporter [Xenococcaceae cyanobacterium MO_188.B29]|nr:SMR family transporter [Xenococcaceae cyanobacterium MO_188.B29]
MLTKFIFTSLIFVTVGLNTMAQVLLKSGATKNILNIYLLGGIVTYGLSTVIYILVLSKFNLSVAYPVVIGLTVIATTVASALLLREKVTSVNWLGIGLMLSGIFAVAFGRTT